MTPIPKVFCAAGASPREKGSGADPEGPGKEEIAQKMETPGDFFKLEEIKSGKERKKERVGMKRKNLQPRREVLAKFSMMQQSLRLSAPFFAWSICSFF